jgi:exopolysaccharide production protein ExoQ
VLFRIFERLFVVVLFLSSMHVFTGLMNPAIAQTLTSGSSDLHGSSVAILAGLYGWGSVLVLLRWRRVLRAAVMAWPLVVLVALTLFSTFWSVDPILTLRRGALVLASTVVAIYLGERYSMENLARMLAQTMCLLITLVLAFYFVARGYVIDYYIHVGAWTGLTGYKNTFGEYMAVAITLLLLVRFRYFPWLRWLFLGAAAALVLLSRSATALLCCALVVAAMPLWRFQRRSGWQKLLVYTTMALVFFLGLCFVYLVTGTGPLFEILGRDSTLTGRTGLWGNALSAVLKRPVLGYGYGAFWSVMGGEATNVWLGAGWMAPRADNGYIDLGLALGVLGLGAFALLFVLSAYKASQFARFEPGRMSIWPISYLCFFALHNVTESTLLTTGTFPFLAFAMVTVSLAVNRRRIPVAISATYARQHMNATEGAGEYAFDVVRVQ